MSVSHTPSPSCTAKAVSHGARMSKSPRQSHGARAVIAAVGLPASLPRLSRSPGTSWWPQASLTALGKPGADPAQVVPSGHCMCSGNVDSSISTGFDGLGFVGSHPAPSICWQHTQLWLWLLQGDLGHGSSQECARLAAKPLQEQDVRMEMETVLGYERWGRTLSSACFPTGSGG